MPYYLIATWEGPGYGWAPQFGEADKDAAEQEIEDTYVDDGFREMCWPRHHIKLVRFPAMPTQAAINAKLATVPAPRRP